MVVCWYNKHNAQAQQNILYEEYDYASLVFLFTAQNNVKL